MRKFFLPTLAGILVILVIIKVIHNQKKGRAKTTAPAAQVVPAESYLARDTIISFPLHLTGFIRANEKVDLVCELPGRIVRIGFREGSRVGKGELLFQLDDQEDQASLRKVEARLELAMAGEARLKHMLETGGSSQQAYDEAVSERKVLEGEAAFLRVRIGKARIVAPFAGTVGIRNVSEGAYVGPGTILTTLEDNSRLKLELSVPSKHANMVRAGEKLRFRYEGIDDTLTATVAATDPSIEPESGNIRVLAVMDGRHPGVVPGASVTVKMQSSSGEAALYVPSEALIATPAGYKAYCLRAGKAELRPVKTGLRSERMVEVTEGLVRGDTVLTTGFMKLRPGASVNIQKTW